MRGLNVESWTGLSVRSARAISKSAPEKIAPSKSGAFSAVFDPEAGGGSGFSHVIAQLLAQHCARSCALGCKPCVAWSSAVQRVFFGKEVRKNLRIVAICLSCRIGQLIQCAGLTRGGSSGSVFPCEFQCHRMNEWMVLGNYEFIFKCQVVRVGKIDSVRKA